MDTENNKKHVTFYMTNYVRKLREDLRQTQRWLRQAENHCNTNQDGVDRYKDTIAGLERKIHNASADDSEFKDYMESMLNTCEKIKTDHSKRMESSLKEREDQKQKLEEYYQNERAQNRKERQKEWQMKREYERMLSIDASMPSYMRENLANFPRNKGYIFKGVWYFGPKPVHLRRGEDPDVYIMFEKKYPGNTLLIHEIKYGSYHRIYEKKNKESQKVLIEDRPSIPKF